MNLTTRHKMAIARGLQLPVVALRRLARRGPVTDVRRRGLRWRLDLREGIDFSIWLRGSFEPATVAAYRRLLSPGAVVVDIGANIGAHTLPLARAVGEGGRVFACEPTHDAFARLLANVAANPDLARRVETCQVMLLGAGDAPLPESVISSWPLAGGDDVHPTIRGRAVSTTGARTATLDACVEEWGLDRVDLVKLDVDGYECDVLDGAGGVLGRHRPPIVTEIAPYALEAAGRSAGELLERFAAAGYALEHLDGRPVTDGDVAQLARRPAGYNVIARAGSARPG